MRLWGLAALVLLASLTGHDVGAQGNGCQDLPACIQVLRATALARSDRYGGIDREEGEAKRRVLRYPGAVDALIPLLKDPDRKVAVLAAYTLRDAPPIDPTYLPQIREALDRGLSWLAPALGRMGTDAAAKEAVDRFLVSRGAPANQEAYAVELSGRLAMPYIVERASCHIPCTDQTHAWLAYVLEKMGSERAAAGPGLMRIASDRTASPQAAKGALLMIAALGSDGRPLEADLLRERDATPYLAPWINHALVGIRSSQAGAIFAERLADNPDMFKLRDLAEIGSAGHDAGPAVVDILEHHPESGLRAAAARTLGFIGYVEATPALVAALDDPVDARVAWAAATSLGRLKARDALAALDRTASRYWFPPVRKAAQLAAMRIRTGDAVPERRPRANFAMTFLEYDSINEGLPECRQSHETTKREPKGSKLYARTSSRALKRLQYPSEIIGYGAADEEAQKAAGAEIIRVGPDNMVEQHEPIMQVPDVALRVDGGWLAGSNRGEWGGELMFIGDDGRSRKIIDDNIEDIHRLGTRIVATTGLAHLTMNRGTLMSVSRDTGGTWRARLWRVLPGAPRVSSLVEPDGLMVGMFGGGSIVIDADGDMRMADCGA